MSTRGSGLGEDVGERRAKGYFRPPSDELGQKRGVATNLHRIVGADQ